jgi:hypothetical protein
MWLLFLIKHLYLSGMGVTGIWQGLFLRMDMKIDMRPNERDWTTCSRHRHHPGSVLDAIGRIGVVIQRESESTL